MARSISTAWIACSHLLEWGHRRIGFICATNRYAMETTLRWQGHLRALAESERAGHPAQTRIHAAEDVAVWERDPDAMAAYFRSPDGPTGIVAWNDFEAVRFIRLLHSARLRVPEDISIVGFDKLPVSEDCIPPLTTVDQYVETQLRTVMEMLSRPTAPPSTQSFVIVPTLVKRSSCAPPRAG